MFHRKIGIKIITYDSENSQHEELVLKMLIFEITTGSDHVIE